MKKFCLTVEEIPTIKMEAIQTAINAIQNDQTDILRKTLQTFPLYRLEVQRSDALLVRLLMIAFKYQRKEAVNVIVSAFEDAQPNDQYRLPIAIHLFELMAIDEEALGFFVRSLENITFADVVDELVRYDSGDMTLQAIRRADDLFGEQTHHVYKTLLEMAQEFENDIVAGYLLTRVAETSAYAPVPSWVKNFVEGSPQEEAEIPYESEITLNDPNPTPQPLPSNETLVELLTEGLIEQGISFENIDEAKDTLRTQLAISSNEEKAALAAPVLSAQDKEALVDDQDLFRILGPVNAYYDIDLTMNHKCSRYGGCRMLTCTCFANYDYDDDFEDVDTDEIDWFTGSCEQCHLKIARRPHAFRLPRVNGAWRGCYCSTKCAREALTDRGQAMIIGAMITRIEGQLNRLGIQDRYDGTRPPVSTEDQGARAGDREANNLEDDEFVEEATEVTQILPGEVGIVNGPVEDWRRIAPQPTVNLDTLLPNYDGVDVAVSTTADNLAMEGDTNLSGAEKLFVQ